jgi:hypothetical protein
MASGKLPMPADIVGEVSQLSGYDMFPWAITSPIYVDTNGDGFQPMAIPWVSAQPLPSPLRQRALVVPRDCDPSALHDDGRGEPPLNAPEDILMPLLRR